MGRAARGLTIVAIKAAATNGAKDARRSRALCTRCVLAVLAGDRRRLLAVHAVLAREQLFVPRQDSYTKAVFVRVAAMVRMRAVNAHGDGVFRTSRSDAIDSRRHISATLVWTPSRGRRVARPHTSRVSFRAPGAKSAPKGHPFRGLLNS